MNSDKLNELIRKIPLGLLFAVYCLYQGFLFYDFGSNPASPLIMKKQEVATARENKKKLELKLKEANEFVKTLEKKKVELRGLAVELQNMKETISDRLDIPSFMKMTITESKKLGITVLSLKPAGSINKEFYVEQGFNLNVRCIFAQAASFLERLTNVSDIVRVESFSMKPVSGGSAKYVMLDIGLDLKTYRYLGSTADRIGKSEALSTIDTAPASTPAKREGKP